MRRGFSAVIRVTVGVCLGAGILVVPGPGVTGAIARAADCPAPPVTIEKLSRMTSDQGLACYGKQLLTFVAYVPPQPTEVEYMPLWEISPAWLNGFSGSFVELTPGNDDGYGTHAWVPPALGRCYMPVRGRECPFASYVGRWARVSAHFDGPVARTCRVVSHAPGVTFTNAGAIRQCRQSLIVLSVGPVGGATPPPTSTLAAAPAVPERAPTPLLGLAGLALASLLLASCALPSRSFLVRRRPSW